MRNPLRRLLASILSLALVVTTVEPALATVAQTPGSGAGAPAKAVAAAPALRTLAALGRGSELGRYPAFDAALKGPLTAAGAAAAVDDLLRYAADSRASASWLEAAAADVAALSESMPELASRLVIAEARLSLAAQQTRRGQREAVLGILADARSAFEIRRSQDDFPTGQAVAGSQGAGAAPLAPAPSAQSAADASPASAVPAPGAAAVTLAPARAAASPWSYQGFGWLMGTHLSMVFTDNLLKAYLMVALLGVVYTGFGVTIGSAALIGGVGAALAVSWPFLAGHAGRLSDRVSRSAIIKRTTLGMIPVMAAAAGLLVAAPLAATIPFMLLAVAGTGVIALYYTTARESILRQYVPGHAYDNAVGQMTMASNVMIIASLVTGGLLTMLPVGVAAAVMAGFAALTWLLSLKLPATEAVGGQPSSVASALKDVKNNRPDLWRVMLGSTFIAFLGSLALTAIPNYGKDLLDVSKEMTGLLQATIGLGVGVGAVVAGKLSRGRTQLGFVALGTVGLAVSALMLATPLAAVAPAIAALALLGVSAGFFMVPLNAYLQSRSSAAETGRNVGLNNFLFGIATFLGSMAFTVISLVGGSPAVSFGVLAVATTALAGYLFVKFPSDAVRAFLNLLMPLFYTIKVSGLENVPMQGGAVIAGNHASLDDGLAVGSVIPRHMRFMMAAELFAGSGKFGAFKRKFLTAMKVIPVSRENADQALAAGVEELKAGRLVNIYPEGHVTRIGQMLGFRKKGVETLAREANAPIVPFFIDRPRDTTVNYTTKNPIRKLLAKVPVRQSIRFGKPLPPTATADDVRHAVMELGRESFDERLSQKPTLFRGFIESAKKHWGELAMIDRPNPEKPENETKLSFGRALVATALLSAALQSKLPANKNVGVLVPATVGAGMANLALTGMGKVPVNLNFVMNKDNMKASLEALDYTIEKGELGAVLTSEKVLKRFNIPRKPNMIMLEDLMAEVKALPKWKAALTLLDLKLSSPERIARKYFPNASSNIDDTATILFTTGSTGLPKGVMLSHRNVWSNVQGVGELFPLSPKDRIVGTLPLFHAFGLTATLWMPMLLGFGAIFHPDPRDKKTVLDLIQKHKGSIIPLTPSLLSPLIDELRPEQVTSLRYVIAGAAKLDPGLAVKIERKTGAPALEGWGMTELAPVGSINVPNAGDKRVWQQGQILGSVGRPMPGVTLRIVDPANPDPNKPLGSGETGLLLVRGSNVMQGYYKDEEKTQETMIGDWLNTGDLFQMDQHGVFRFVDRASRMAKVKDEKVSLGYVENELNKAADRLDIAFVVVSLPDPATSEKLVVLYAGWDGDIAALQAKMKANGVKNLNIPLIENFHKVDALPLVGIGKPNYKAAKQMAKDIEAGAKPQAPTGGSTPAPGAPSAPGQTAPAKEYKSEPSTFRAPKGDLKTIQRMSGPAKFLLRKYFKIDKVEPDEIDLPAADRERLIAATRPEKAFIFGPVHPEFTTDWLIDKLIIDQVAQETVHWADDTLVKMAPGFLGANNVMSNKGGQAAKDFSIRRALMGKGVLLHPEGGVGWVSDRVGTLFDGAAEMGVDAATLSGPNGREVGVIPLVWKINYTGDVTPGLHKEMALIEKSLKLPSGDGLTIPERFRRLQEQVFQSRLTKYGVPRKELLADGAGFFERQDAARRHHLRVLREKHPEVEPGDTDAKTLARLRKAIGEKLAAAKKKKDAGADIEALKFQLGLADEAVRLGKFTREVYGAPRLTQEQVGESLKRIRADLMSQAGFIAFLRNKAFPKPFGPREAHLRIPAIIEIPKTGQEPVEAYTKRLRDAMQQGLDEINAKIKPLTDKYSHRNPFVAAPEPKDVE